MKVRRANALPPDRLVRLTSVSSSPRGGAPMLNLKPARILPIMIGGLVLFGCDVQRSAGPNDVPQFSRSITLPGLDSLLGAGPARVKIWLMPGTLVARRVVVKQAEQLTRSERIDGRVTAIAASATADPRSVAIGDLNIAGNSDTKCTGQHEEGDDDDNHPPPTSLAEFTMRVQHRSEEHTSELQSRQYLVCRLLLEKKKNKITQNTNRY